MRQAKIQGRRREEAKLKSFGMTGPITLEQLCRDLWRADKQRYLAKMGKTGAQLFIKQFEREDAERNRAAQPGFAVAVRIRQ
jgi:RNA polymerase-interacting CarD/CdnL/TRCF family regulator